MTYRHHLACVIVKANVIVKAKYYINDYFIHLKYGEITVLYIILIIIKCYMFYGNFLILLGKFSIQFSMYKNYTPFRKKTVTQ
jgi:hypothetical protein